MKWKDKPFLNKLAEVVMLLSIGGYFGLNSLRAKGEEVSPALPKFCIAAALFCLGISYWNVKRKAAVIYFALAALVLALTLMLL